VVIERGASCSTPPSTGCCDEAIDTDVLVIGSGIAGLTFALKAAEHGDVCIVTKKERAVSSTNYAQGGIAAVMAPDDAPELHVRDTLVAGAGLCHLRGGGIARPRGARTGEGPDRLGRPLLPLRR
jgi:glycine/D-amino acid oxidase-like deaminating enzyme